MADSKLSRTKELAAIDTVSIEALSPQKSRLSVMPFSTLLPQMGALTSLYEHAEKLSLRLEEIEGQESKELSMLQQVVAWLKMGES